MKRTIFWILVAVLLGVASFLFWSKDEKNIVVVTDQTSQVVEDVVEDSEYIIRD